MGLPVHLAPFAPADPGVLRGRQLGSGHHVRGHGKRKVTFFLYDHKHAKVVFIAQPNAALAGAKVAEYRAKVAEAGRDPRSIKVLPGLLIVLGKTTRGGGTEVPVPEAALGRRG